MIICYVSQQKGFIKYIETNTLENDQINTWKIITPTANGKMVVLVIYLLEYLKKFIVRVIYHLILKMKIKQKNY